MADAPTSTESVGENGRLLHVLMVEDSAEDAERVVLQLNSAGCQVDALCVTTAAAMQGALANQEWDIVLAGNAVPGMDAMAALAMLQQSGRDIPFIILSGVMSDDMAAAVMRAGARDYLHKNNLSR